MTTLQNIRRYQTGGLTLATGQTNEDPEVTVEEEEVVPSPSPRAAARLTTMLERLRNERAGPSESDKWWAISSALARPTTSGGRFGQTLSNIGEAMTGYSTERRKAEQEKSAMISKYELGLAELEDRADYAKAVLAAKTAGTAVETYTMGGAYFDDAAKRTVVPVLVKTGPRKGQVLKMTPQEAAALGATPADATPAGAAPVAVGAPAVANAPDTGASSTTAPTVTSAPAAAKAPAISADARWRAAKQGEVVEGSILGLTPGVSYFAGRTGWEPVPGTGVAIPTRPDPYGLGGEQILKNNEWVYKPGQSPEELEARARVKARSLGVPYQPPPLSEGQTIAQRGATLQGYIKAGTARMEAIREEAAKASKAAADTEQFLALNRRSEGLTGPVKGKAFTAIGNDDIKAMTAITARLKVLADRTPGSVSNYEDAGLVGSVPNVSNNLRANTILGNRIKALKVLTQEQQQFSTAWQLANRGSLVGADEAWSQYVKANPIFDRKDPNGLANAKMNPNRVPWRQWARQTYYPTDGGANAAPASASARPAQGGAPTLAQFMAAARKAPKNAKVSDAALQAYYDKTYGGR